MKKIYAIFVCLIFLGTILSTAAVVVAKKPENPGGGKPGGGAGPTGTVFFSMADENGDGYIWTVNPDGSDLTKQTRSGAGVSSLSWKTHNDHYWYIGLVAIDGETYPDGQPRQEIYAIRDDNTMGFQMTDDEDMEFSPTVQADQSEQLIWVPGDGYISWVAKVWTLQEDDTYAYDYGIYRAEVLYDDGDVSGLGVPEYAYDTGSWYDEYNDIHVPDIWTYSWNPDGDEIAFQRHDNNIYIDSIYGDSPTQLVSGSQPRWSPDGTKILFSRYQEMLVINVDGTGETSLEKVSNTQHHVVRGTWGEEWSPDGKYVVYTIWEHNLRNWNFKTTMYTIKSDGTGRSSISGFGASVIKVSKDWR